MTQTANLAIPKPPKGSNQESGYFKTAAGEDTPARAAADLIDKYLAAEFVGAVIAAGGAITQKFGLARLGSAGALAVSIADPVAVTDDGKRLTLIAVTAHAHVITVTGGIGPGTNNTITLGGAIGDHTELEAIAGKWFLRPGINATASHV